MSETLTEEQGRWRLGDEVLAQGTAHPSLRVLDEAWQGLLKALAETKEQGDNLKRIGAGRTEHPTIVVANVLPHVRHLADQAAAVERQLRALLADP